MTIVSCKLYLCVFTNGILSLAGPKSTYLTHGALLLQLVTLALRECPLGLGKLIDPAILHYPRGAQVDGAQGGGSLAPHRRHITRHDYCASEGEFGQVLAIGMNSRVGRGAATGDAKAVKR